MSGMPSGNLPGWTQIVAQDFDAAVSLGTVSGTFPASAHQAFSCYDGFPDTSGHGLHAPRQVLSVHDSMLDWYLHTVNGQPLVSAVVVAVPSTGWGQCHGRYAVRFRSSLMPGYKLAFLLWPDDDNWEEGEIDFPEAGSLDGSELYANMYPAGRPVLDAGSAGFRTGTAAAGSGWHTAVTTWEPGSVSYSLDGHTLGTSTAGVPSTSFHWVLQVETSIGVPPPAPGVAGHVQVDWVAMWTRK